MKKTLIFCLTLVSFICHSQELDYYKAATDKFMKLYNSENYDGIFEMFDSNMKAALPKDNTAVFFNDLRESVGKIKSTEFINTRPVHRLVPGAPDEFTSFPETVAVSLATKDMAVKPPMLFPPVTKLSQLYWFCATSLTNSMTKASQR